jgi:hypothetical protein
LDAIDDDLGANINDFHIGVVLFLCFVNRLIDLLVLFDAVEKVLNRHFRVFTLVIGAGGLDFDYIGHDDITIIANTFDKKTLDAFADAAFMDPHATTFGRVGGIEDCNDALALTKPFDHVIHGCFSRSTTQPFALSIGGVEKICRWTRCLIAPIGSYIEGFGRDG